MRSLFRYSPPFFRSKPGLYGTGLGAGIATGLASIGGMVVALYVLSGGREARVMRASLVMFLAIGMVTSMIYLLMFGVLDAQAWARWAVLVPICLIGVATGSFLFRPSLQVFYRQFCLILLVGLSLAGLAKLLM